MRVKLTSVFVDDQAKAEDFYTTKLGFVVADDVPLGEYRWLTVSSPDEPEGARVLLEPAAHPAVAPFREALMADGIPFASFEVDDVVVEHARLRDLGVTFTQLPTDVGPVTIAVFDDTVGNLIQLSSLN